MLVVVEGHVQFAERLIQELDHLGSRAVEVVIGVALEILPGAFGLYLG